MPDDFKKGAEDWNKKMDDAGKAAGITMVNHFNFHHPIDRWITGVALPVDGGLCAK